MWCDYLSGWIAGVAGVVVGYPFDTIKIQQQVYGLKLREAVDRIYRHRGPKGFYRGLPIPLMTYGTLNALFFGIYGDICDYLVARRLHHKGWEPDMDSAVKVDLSEDAPEVDEFLPEYHPFFTSSRTNLKINTAVSEEFDFGTNKGGATFIEMLVAGSVASMMQLTFAAPADLIKTKLQSQMKRRMFKGPVNCFHLVVRDAGITGIYRGLTPMMLRNMGGSGINYTVVCYGMGLCGENIAPSSLKQGLVAHSAAGLASWWFVLPFDVIKTRMQADDHRFPQFRSAIHCAKEIIRGQGIVGLYRGFWSCTARAVPVSLTTFLGFEFLHDTLC